MYIEVRTIGKKKKYYLVHSFRKDEKVRKLRVYLGADLSEEQIKEKKALAEEIILRRKEELGIIHDPYLTVLSSSEINELRSLEAKGTIKIKHLTEDDWINFTETFAYNTNAIEGSSVTEEEVVDILEKDAHPSYRKGWEISETYGVAKAVKYIRKTKEQISLNLIKKLHELIFKESKPFAGQFRKKGEEVVVVDGLGHIVHRGAPSSEIVKLLIELIKWYEKNKERYSPLVLAAIVHNQFENIHPFADGNGRVGRLLLNNILLKHNKPPVNIELKNQRAYYTALREYQNNGNIRLMLELILKEYKELKKILGDHKK